VSFGEGELRVVKASNLSLSCKLDTGWCLFTVQVGDQTLHLQACHLRDSVRDLAAAANAVSEGAAIPDIWMCDEPVYHRWLLAEGKRLRIVIENHCEGEIRVVLEAEVEAAVFVAEVHRVLWELSYYHDLGCYQELWGHEFPVELF
jgi:hypothetical protein